MDGPKVKRMQRTPTVHTRSARLLNKCTTIKVSLRTYWGVDLLCVTPAKFFNIPRQFHYSNR